MKELRLGRSPSARCPPGEEVVELNTQTYLCDSHSELKRGSWGSLGGAAVWRLPLAQGAILETRDGVPCWAPGAWSLLLPLPVSLPLSLSLCDYH